MISSTRRPLEEVGVQNKRACNGEPWKGERASAHRLVEGDVPFRLHPQLARSTSTYESQPQFSLPSFSWNFCTFSRFVKNHHVKFESTEFPQFWVTLSTCWALSGQMHTSSFSCNFCTFFVLPRMLSYIKEF